MLRKLLCLIGGHDWYFVMNSGVAYTVDPKNNGRAANALWKCRYCDAYKWHWYLWALRSSKLNGGFY